MADSLSLIVPCIPALRRYARALLRDRVAADDLVQECLAQALARWHQRRGDGDPRSWLLSIVHNLAISQLRAQRRRGAHVSLDDAASNFARPPTQEHGIEHAELLRALEQLTDEHRAVLLLISVEDLSYADTAEVLGVPVGTVMSRLSRARTQLAQLLEIHRPSAPALRRLK